MSARVKRQIDTLKVLKSANPRLRKAILVNGNSDLILALCEVIANVLSGTVHLAPQQKHKLKKHKAVLRRIVDRSTNVKNKRQLIVQKGGFLPALLAPALGLLSTIIASVV